MAVAQIRGGVPEGIRVSGRGASRDRTILPVLQSGTATPEPAIPDAGDDLAAASMTPMTRPTTRNGASLNSGTLSPNPWDLTPSGQNSPDPLAARIVHIPFLLSRRGQSV